MLRMYTYMYLPELAICDWICQNQHNNARIETDPFYSLTWKPHSSTIQTNQWQGWARGWPGLLSQAAFIWPCKFMMVHYGVYGATGGHTNKAACGVKLLPTTVLPWHVQCGCFCALLNTQRLFPYASGWFDPPSASHRPPPIELIHDIGGVQKKVSQYPAVLAR